MKAKILSNETIAPDYRILTLGAGTAAKKTKPGQFFNIKVNDGDVPLLRRPFGAHRIGKNTVTILYKIVGPATRLLAGRKPGGFLDVIGPLGNGFDTGGVKSAVLAAGGHGVAPLYALAERLLAGGADVTIAIGGRSRSHIVGDGMFKRLGARVKVVTEDGSRGTKGLITDELGRLFAAKKRGQDKTAVIYACGPNPMLKAVARFAARNGVNCQLSMEAYLGCGTGLCMGCAVRTVSGRKLVCKDGPVFSGRELLW